MFDADGVVDQVLSAVGIHTGGWVSSPTYSLGVLIALAVWQFGAPMVIFLAGLKQIPSELYDAAAVDGAGWWRTLRSVTLPMLSPVIFFNLVLETIHAFQAFTAAFVVSGGRGGPVDSTLFYTLYLYLKGFNEFRMGYASAMAWVLVLVVAVVTAVLFRTARLWVFYAGEK
jgi:multiple sugar transport system permease protein